jgi:hypothetical protein
MTETCGETVCYTCGEDIPCQLPKGHEGEHSWYVEDAADG